MEVVVGCDTFVALPPATNGPYVIFGKNSDRPSEEVQEVIFLPPKNHEKGCTLECTYIEIPEVAHTYGMVLSKPAWMWGAEMGANEHGVVIGNEAVWTTLNHPSTDSQEKLLGMDLLRLGLERGKCAREALDVVTSLLESQGQGGPCSEDMPGMTYHNSFLLADREEAWVLETAANHWAAQRMQKGTRNISNNLTITTAMDLQSKGLLGAAREEGWKGSGQLNFGETFSASGMVNDQERQTQGAKLLRKFSSGSDPSVSGFKPFVFDGDNTMGSGLILSPQQEPGKDPAKQLPRFKFAVERRHELYKAHDKALSNGPEAVKNVLKSIRDVEEENVANSLKWLRDSQETGIPGAGHLFAKSVEKEFEIYEQSLMSNL